MPASQHEPWDKLRELLQADDRPGLDAFLTGLPAKDVLRTVSRLSRDEQVQLLLKLAPDDAADVVEQLPSDQATTVVQGLEPDDAARIVTELKSDSRADLIGSLAQPNAEAILAALPDADARQVRALVEYPDDTAGGLMVTEYLAYSEQKTVGGVIRDLREKADTYADYDVQYAFVLNRQGQLVGVLRLRDLLLSPEQTRIGTLMIRDPLAVRDTSSLDELHEFFNAHNFYGVPVLDADNRLIGVVHRVAVDDSRAERSDRDHMRSQGIIRGEELRSMPLTLRSRRRLAWLSVNVVLNLIAASVIAAYQDTLQAAIALAVFLPIISDMSGCSGNQAVAVTMRELSLGLITPADAARVWLKEVGVGILNGIALGLLIALTAWLWKSNAYLGLVVGGALALNTVVAVSIGGTVPLLLRRFGLDPALASGPVLTTVTDMCGFFLTLTFASAALPHLTN